MSRALITESYLTGIANAIRAKNGSSDTYTPPQMAAAIQAIPTGGITPTGTVNITQNGTHDVTQYASANVNVPNSYAAGDEGKVVSNGALVAQTSRSITANGTYDTTTNDEVVVSVAPNLQSKTVTQNGTVTPDQGYDGLSSVEVNVSGGGGASKNITPVSRISGNNIVAEFEASGITKASGTGISTVQPTDQGFMTSFGNDCFFADLDAANRDQTIYAVVKSLVTDGNWQGVGSNYASSGGNAPNIFTSYSKWNASVYGGDTNLNITSTVFHVLTISIDATAKTCAYYIDGVSYGTKSFSNCGRYPSIGGGTTNGTGVTSTSKMGVLYGAIVAETHDSETVIANHQTLLSVYSDYIGT